MSACHTATGNRVLIAPMRGSNCSTPRTMVGPPTRPHRPYEGQQPQFADPLTIGHQRPHRPYEGQQRIELSDHYAQLAASSSPL